MNCSQCDDTGWRHASTNGVRRVERCSCWQQTVASRLLVDSRVPPRYRQCDLDRFTLYPNEKLVTAVTRARRFAEAFPAVTKGLCLIGPPGIGKTHIAVAVLNQVVSQKGVRGLFYDVRDLLRMIRSTYNPVVRAAEMDILRPVMEAELLVLDDLGAEKPSEWVEETMNLIVNTRYNERRPTIFTTNYENLPDDADLESLKVRVGFRLHSRLHEMCEFLEYDGGDYRMLEPNGDAADLETLWKKNRGRRTLPARAHGQARADVRRTQQPVEPQVSREITWPGGKAGRVDNFEVRTSKFEVVMIGLYLHIPFCQAICSYCNFNRGLLDDALKVRYVDALEREIREAGDGRPADTIFFGGGTPSLLSPAEVGRLIAACRAAYDVSADAEITLETNPETSSFDRMAGFLDAGVTRISFGAQTFDEAQLRRLGRIHTAARIGEAVREARAAGVGNLSLDLMFWLPGLSRASWLESVEQAIALGPDHLSLYLLELYPNAPIRELILRGETGVQSGDTTWAQSAGDEAADMYLDALGRLDEAGFRQYEISNVARAGLESRHNLKYWTEGSWRGFGCGAHTTLDGVRWHNVASTVDYVDRIAQGASVSVASGLHELSRQEQIQEGLFTGLRLTRGVDRQAFRDRHGLDPWLQYEAALADSLEAKLLWVTPEAFGLTRPGMLLANEVMVTFV